MDEIINIKENSNVEIEVQVQGMTCMFQSKRMLLGNYYTFQDRQMKIERRNDEQSLLLYDEERQIIPSLRRLQWYAHYVTKRHLFN